MKELRGGGKRAKIRGHIQREHSLQKALEKLGTKVAAKTQKSFPEEPSGPSKKDIKRKIRFEP